MHFSMLTYFPKFSIIYLSNKEREIKMILINAICVIISLVSVIVGFYLFLAGGFSDNFKIWLLGLFLTIVGAVFFVITLMFIC